MRIGSLFTGYGGLDMAASARLDAQVVWVSDNDKAAARVLDARYDAPNLGDVDHIDWETVEPVDVLTGGTPCQDLSHAGQRAGFRPGTRSNLWLIMCDAIAILRPKIIVWENVVGVLSARADSDVEYCPGCMGKPSNSHLRAFGRVVGDLASLGYDAEWCGVRASDIGAPHPRYRIFLTAHRADQPPRRRQWPAPTRTENPQPIALLPTPVVNDRGNEKTLEWWDEWAPRQKAADGTPAPHGKSLAIEALRLLPTPTVRDSGHGNHANKGGNPTLVGATLGYKPGDLRRHPDHESPHWGDYAAAITRWENTLGRPAPAPTITSAKGNQQLSPAFVEWMMGLPDGWVTGVDGITRTHALKMLGNGVVPQQAAYALDQLGWYP